MKIVIFILAIIAVKIEQTLQMCRNVNVQVSSSMQPKEQTFKLDVKKIKSKDFKVNENQFNSGSLVPIEEVGLVLEKLPNSKVLDPIHAKYFRNENSTIWIPYSYASNWVRNNFKVSTQMTRTSTSNTDTPLVHFEFINEKDFLNISEEDMTNFLNILRKNTNKRQTIKTVIKDNILSFQNSILRAIEDIKNAKAANAKIDKLIEENLKKLEELNKKIEAITKEINTVNTEVSVQTTETRKQENYLTDLTNNLKDLEKDLEKKKKSLSQLKPTDLTAIKNNLEQSASNMIYSNIAPKEFKIEHSISINKLKEYVESSYKECNAKVENVNKCLNLAEKKVIKKFRKSFF